MATLQNFAFAGNKITEQVATTTPVSRVVRNEYGGVVATLNAEPYNGTATINYEAIARAMFNEERTIAPGCSVHYIDRLVRAKLLIGNGEYLISRGVAQNGETSIAETMKILTTLKEIKAYEGYESGFVFALKKTSAIEPITVTYNDVNIEEGAHMNMMQEILWTKFVITQGTKSGICAIKSYSEVKDEIHVTICETPAHPFYVRWINERGGYDYWMFACNQGHTISLDANEYYESADGDGEFLTGSKTAKEVVEVSSGVVDADTMKALERLPLSPDIRLFNKNTNKWVRIQMDSTETERMENQSTGEIIMSFVLPSIQINK